MFQKQQNALLLFHGNTARLSSSANPSNGVTQEFDSLCALFLLVFLHTVSNDLKTLTWFPGAFPDETSWRGEERIRSPQDLFRNMVQAVQQLTYHPNLLMYRHQRGLTKKKTKRVQLSFVMRGRWLHTQVEGRTNVCLLWSFCCPLIWRLAQNVLQQTHTHTHTSMGLLKNMQPKEWLGQRVPRNQYNLSRICCG